MIKKEGNSNTQVSGRSLRGGVRDCTRTGSLACAYEFQLTTDKTTSTQTYTLSAQLHGLAR